MKVKHAVEHKSLQGELWLPNISVWNQNFDYHTHILPPAFVYLCDSEEEGKECG